VISYLRGDATCPQAAGPKIVAHVCNDSGGWGRGFVLALSARWPGPEAEYRRWYSSRVSPLSTGRFARGEVQLVRVLPDVLVANMVAQAGTRAGSKGPPIRYPALEACLGHLRGMAELHRASVHMPRIGCGLAGGRWELVEPLVRAQLPDLDVWIYDL